MEAQQCRPNKGKDGQPTQDPEADWNVKTGADGKRKSTYGYKAHMNVDEAVSYTHLTLPTKA